MNPDPKTTLELESKVIVDAMIRFSVIVLLVFLCLRTFMPFLTIMLWGVMLAIMLYPVHQRLARWLGDRSGRAAILLVIAGVIIMGVPLVLLGSSLTKHINEMNTAFQNQQLTIKQPDPTVAEWPLIGEKVYQVWNEASLNFPQFIEDYSQQIKRISSDIFKAAGNAIGSVVMVFGAFILAAIMMAWGESGSNAMSRIIVRVAGPGRGKELHQLAVATVRSVATGVLGVAFIQALLFGIGFFLAGVPFPGLLALLIMFLGVIQLPTTIVALPVVIYLWAGTDASVVSNVIFTVYFIIVGLVDNVLKPLLLGRGVESPMPVILIGAIGGMISGGFLGMFLGAVLLAVGYQILMVWIEPDKNRSPDDSVQSDPADVMLP